jgi:2-deoxy-D-gluconate 3-dehydrogenase
MTNSPAHRLFDLRGKNAVVTGGSRGLGLAIARALHEAGARVAIVARTAPTQSPVPWQSAAAAFDHVFVPADLTSAPARAGLLERVSEETGEIDILFHCAGQQFRHAAEEFPLDDWAAMLELHLTAAMDLSQQAARRMLPRGSGKIVLMSSIIGFQGGLRVPAYAAAKHAIGGLVQSLANEWAASGINVNALAPGYFETGIGTAVLEDPVRGPQIIGRIPAGRAGRPDELAGAAIFLASNASNYMHGHTLVVDGGWLGR